MDVTSSKSGEYYAATELGDEDDATSLDNLLDTIQWMEECNELRQSDDNSSGLSDLKVSSLLMAIAELDANWSSTNLEHASVFSVGENLAWGYPDPFDGWYTEEKEIYDESGSTDGTGHYENIISSSYRATGFACCTKGTYKTTHCQTFFSSSSYAIYTVEEYAALLDEYAALVDEYLGGSDAEDSSDSEEEDCEHAYAVRKWGWNSSYTWCTFTLSCSECGLSETVSGVISSEITSEPTCTETGTIRYTASAEVDGTTYTTTLGTAALSATGHTEAEAVSENVADATCTEDGSYESVIYCSVCGEELSRETVTVEATGHSYEETSAQEATCAEDGYITYTCSVCGDSYTDIVVTTDHDYVISITSSTCTENGSILYTCSVCGDSYEVVIPASEHTQGEAVVENESAATCTEDGSYDIVVYCTVCGEEISRQAVGVEAAGHSYDDGTVTTEPTETEDGLMTYTCTVCGDTYTEAIPATGTGDGEDTESECEHDYHVAACILKNQSYSSAYFVLSCSICGDTVQLDADILEEIAQDPTCTEEGSVKYTATAEYNGQTFTEELGTEALPATGHTEGEAVTENEVEATCTEEGSYDSVVYCSVCGEELSRETVAVEAAGHSYGEPEWTWEDDYSSATAVFTCEACGDTTEETAAVSCEDGEEDTFLYTASITLDGTEYTSTRTSGYDWACISCLLDETCPMDSFTDLVATAWYHDGVHFCIENELMNGTSSTTFEPGSATTRSMIVTMLYRLAGEPEVEGTSTFNDVEPGSWYEDAVIWAEQEDIAEGYGNGEFGVSDTVTREQIAVFFCRYAEEIEKQDVSAAMGMAGYPDADEVSSWAVNIGLITGQGTGGETYLAPGSDATRSETATILMRFIEYVIE